MNKVYFQLLVDTITDKDNLKKVKEEALKLSRSYSPDEYIQIASELYCSEYFQIQEINYEPEKVKSQILLLDQEIRNTDFEISKLNSIEFDINL